MFLVEGNLRAQLEETLHKMKNMMTILMTTPIPATIRISMIREIETYHTNAKESLGLG